MNIRFVFIISFVVMSAFKVNNALAVFEYDYCPLLIENGSEPPHFLDRRSGRIYTLKQYEDLEGMHLTFDRALPAEEYRPNDAYSNGQGNSFVPSKQHRLVKQLLKTDKEYQAMQYLKNKQIAGLPHVLIQRIFIFLSIPDASNFRGTDSNICSASNSKVVRRAIKNLMGPTVDEVD